ncbi:N-acetylglucosamine-6-phosphate deacetylase [Vibrio sp. MACH09]|uniref:N-acetylglucosamine-6-phosphate deacetylase n=1 Tax=Vibrio sp. MACH09 TaxID=3025122 RepID=UPI002793C72C|nr:N-acetylglucosamine-6-phosphate deacetylase [Vibrio sp. MACH09]GLO63584.1 N-acetylglucosamine-6-phosphate deacetylase [Vibrio sp. MACH09]
MASDIRYYRAARILQEREWRDNAIIGIDSLGAIASIDDAKGFANYYTDLGDCSLMPGLIDSHVHGAMGCDVMDATHSSFVTMSQFFAQQGVTGFVATTVTAPVEKIKRALIQIGKSKAKGLSGAELLGGFLEGPYFTATHKGAHPEQLFRELDNDELDKWIGYSDSSLIAIALAPEKNNALKAIKHLKRQGIKVMLAHTDASYQQVTGALDNGADGIVHCYNGMRGLHHRDPGVVGAGLCHDNCYVEMIADGHHVHPVAIDVAHRCCGDRLTLITDAMQAAGMPDGQYQLGEYNVTMSQGVVRTDSGSLAGSSLLLIDSVKNIAEWLKIPFEEAWLLASLTPARSLNLHHQYGTLSVGKMASMVAVSDSYQILHTWVNGQNVFSNNSHIASEAICI